MEVRFDPGAELYVYGQLTATGAPTLPIKFTGSTACATSRPRDPYWRRRVDLPADWLISVSPAQVQLTPGQEISVTVSIVPGAPVLQGSVPRVAIEGYAGSTLLGDVVLDVLVPRYAPFGQRTVYLPLIRR